MLNRWQIREIVKRALEEDLYFGDLTTELVIKEDKVCRAYFLAKEFLVVCGLPVVEEVFFLIDPEVKITWKVREGEEVEPFTKFGTVEGRAKSILKAERVSLNFLQHLSGIATYTRKIVKKISNHNTILLDTRKTLPGLKILQKYAVRVGGGQNHRFSLSDGILIKDNHLKLIGGIENLSQVLKDIPHYLKVEVEVKTLKELKLILQQNLPIDLVMLDNFKPEEITEALKLIRQFKPGLKIEVSGGIKLENAEEIAKLGVDYISSGSLTHSVKAVDISLKIE